MPNRYEREIEEILRNLEHTEPATSRKSSERPRPRTVPRPRPRPKNNISFSLSTVEWFLITSIVLALLSGGYAYIAGPNIVTGVIAIGSFLFLLLVAFSHFVLRPQNRAARSNYGNVTRIRRGPISNFRSRIHLMRLKMRYRKKGKP
jgi:hypothetical protein